MHPAHEDIALVAALGRIRPPDHLCSIYETADEQHAVVMPFMRLRLERSEKCIYGRDARAQGPGPYREGAFRSASLAWIDCPRPPAAPSLPDSRTSVRGTTCARSMKRRRRSSSAAAGFGPTPAPSAEDVLERMHPEDRPRIEMGDG